VTYHYLCFYQMFRSIVINWFIILSVYTVCPSVLSVHLLIVFCLFWRINVLITDWSSNHAHVAHTVININVANHAATTCRPGGGGTISPVRLAADLRPSADGSAVRTCPVPGQTETGSVPIA